MSHNQIRLKSRLVFILTFGCICCFDVLLRAADRYVVEPGTIADGNGGIYTSWDIAATQIQWAVAAAESNTAILVSNGTYVLTNQIRTIYGTNITIRSINGRAVTIVDGNRDITANRCFDLFTNATLNGFTVRNGYATNSSGGGGGIRANNAKVYNCRIENNMSSGSQGAGLNAVNTQITNCQIIGNYSTNISAGGVYLSQTKIFGCEIASNISYGPSGYGAGVLADDNSTISNCIIYANIATNSDAYGGGVVLYKNSIICNCLVYRNRATGGGGIWIFATANNTYRPKIQSCTVVSNYASATGAGISIYSYYFNTSYVENTISYYNRGNSSSNLYCPVSGTLTGSFVIVSSCLAPTSAIPTARTVNAGNIQSDPKFIALINGNYRLRADSPCVNAGTNQDWMTNAYDLDRSQRIRYGTVDVGAYERVNEGTVYVIH